MCFEKRDSVELCEIRFVGVSKVDLKKIELYLNNVSPYVLRKEEYFYLITPEAALALEEKVGEICGVIVSPAKLYPDPVLNE